MLHGNRTYLLQDDDGQIIEAHSISAGLDYPGIGPEHSWLHDIGRVEYVSGHRRGGAGGVPAVHADRGDHSGAGAGARAGACDQAGADDGQATQIILMNLCGRGDKDIFTVAEHLGVKL